MLKKKSYVPLANCRTVPTASMMTPEIMTASELGVHSTASGQSKLFHVFTHFYVLLSAFEEDAKTLSA